MLPASIKVLMEAVVSICPTLLMFVRHLKKILSIRIQNLFQIQISMLLMLFSKQNFDNVNSSK
jgi:hypothetical protein